jgi:hypothetical protein
MWTLEGRDRFVRAVVSHGNDEYNGGILLNTGHFRRIQEWMRG